MTNLNNFFSFQNKHDGLVDNTKGHINRSNRSNSRNKKLSNSKERGIFKRPSSKEKTYTSLIDNFKQILDFNKRASKEYPFKGE
jgi:hypothetical protein